MTKLENLRRVLVSLKRDLDSFQVEGYGTIVGAQKKTFDEHWNQIVEIMDSPDEPTAPTDLELGELIRASLDYTNAHHAVEPMTPEYKLIADWRRWAEFRLNNPPLGSIGNPFPNMQTASAFTCKDNVFVDAVPRGIAFSEPTCDHGHGKVVYTQAGTVFVCDECGHSRLQQAL